MANIYHPSMPVPVRADGVAFTSTAPVIVANFVCDANGTLTITSSDLGTVYLNVLAVVAGQVYTFNWSLANVSVGIAGARGSLGIVRT